MLAVGLTAFIAAGAAAQTPPEPVPPTPSPEAASPQQPSPQDPPPQDPSPQQSPAPEQPAPEQQPTPEQPPAAQEPPAQEPAPQTPPAGEPKTDEPSSPASTPADAPARRGTPRFLVSANGGYQFLSQDFETSTQFDAFEEQATLTSSGEIKSEPIFDAGVTYRLTDTYGVGASFSMYVTESDVSVVAQIPHPVVFDQIRVANYTAAGVKHTSAGIHLQGVWFMPFVNNLDFAISAGPSIVLVSQDVVTAADLLPESSPFTSPVIENVTVTEQQATAFGFNAGVDAIYSLTPRYGLGVNLRYVFAKADLEGLVDSLTVGGFHIVGGLRVSF
jgi:hypothetical protein